jgi:hypothetical protein
VTRRQKKKRFKRKWLSGHRAAFLRTVPNKWKVSWADKINEIYEEEVLKRMDAAVLYGAGTAGGAVYSKPRVFQSAFCVSCANRDDDPIFAACSVCRSGKNGRPTQYRRAEE